MTWRVGPHEVKNRRRVLLGVCGVDSGQLVIIDPSYGMPAYDEVSRVSLAQHRTIRNAKPLDREEDEPSPGQVGLGVVTSTGFGDGAYEVWAEVAEVEGWGERITSVEVVFIKEDDEPRCEECGAIAAVFLMGVPLCDKHREETEENLRAQDDEAEEHLHAEEEVELARRFE